jgi:hypothetical protein
MTTDPHASILARITRHAPERVPKKGASFLRYSPRGCGFYWCDDEDRSDVPDDYDANNAVELAGLACLLDNGWWLHKLPDGRFRVLPDLNYALAVSGPTIAHAIDAALAHVWKETP